MPCVSINLSPEAYAIYVGYPKKKRSQYISTDILSSRFNRDLNQELTQEVLKLKDRVKATQIQLKRMIQRYESVIRGEAEAEELDMNTMQDGWDYL
jgi:hypothetical protein